MKNEVKLNFSCFACSDRFHSASDLIEHLDWQGEDNILLNCATCNNFFEDLNTLRCHQLSEHADGMDDYQCGICSATFSYEHLLDFHVQRKHCEPEFECLECHEKFHTKAQLQCHVLKSGLCQFLDNLTCQCCEITFLFR